MNEAFLEQAVGQTLVGEPKEACAAPCTELTLHSTAGVLQAAVTQEIPMMYVDADHLETLAQADLSPEAKARIHQAVLRGYGILTPQQMVAWGETQTVAWWQVDLATGAVVDVGEDGTHYFMAVTAKSMEMLFVPSVKMLRTVAALFRGQIWAGAMQLTWSTFWTSAVGQDTYGDKTPEQIYQKALKETKLHMRALDACLRMLPFLPVILRRW